jgi:predicted dehydrogenase
MQASHSPALKFISDLLAQDYVGRVLSTSVLGTGGAPWGLDMIDNNQRVYQDKRNGATVLTIPIGHLLDSLIRLFGTLDEPRTTLAVRKSSVGVRGTDERLNVSSPDQVCISGRFSSGPIGSIHYRTGAQTSVGLHWEINGTEGCLVVKAPTGHFQYGDVAIDGMGKGAKEFERLEIPERYWPVSGPRTGFGYTVAVAYDMICKDLRNGTSYACGIEDAVVLHRNLHAIESAT